MNTESKGNTKKKSTSSIRPLTELSHRLVNEIAYHYIMEKGGAMGIARELKRVYPDEYRLFNLGNENIRNVLKIAIERGMLKLQPLEEEECAGRLYERSKGALGNAYQDYDPVRNPKDKRVSKSIRVLEVGGRLVRPRVSADAIPSNTPNHKGAGLRFKPAPMVEQIADAAAEELMNLIRLVGYRKDRVRIGLGAGNTAQCVVRALGQMVRRERNCPPLALHALTPGFSTDPQKTPVTYFQYFQESGVDLECVGLSTTSFVDVADLENLKRDPGFAEAAAWAEDIDIVITSLAQADDPHGMLYRYMKDYYPDTYEDLTNNGWVGDVHFCPFSDKPLELDRGKRAVSLLGLSDLRRMVETPHKYVLLVAGPCNTCGTLKTDAIRPLLERPSLNVWTHMVMDVETAESLVDDKPTTLDTAAQLPPNDHAKKTKGTRSRKRTPK